MGSGEVVVGVPGSQVLISFLGVVPVFGVGPFAQGGLNEALGFAVGLRGVGAGSVVLESEAEAGLVKLVGAVAAAVIGEQGADANAMEREEREGVAQEPDSGVGLLIGEYLSEGHAGVVVDGDMEGLEPRMSADSSEAAVAAH